jgi:hypothetical protein
MTKIFYLTHAVAYWILDTLSGNYNFDSKENNLTNTILIPSYKAI